MSENSNSSTMKMKKIQMRDFATIFVFIGICIILSIAKGDVFLSGGNVENIFKQIATNSILAGGMTIVLLTGGIDLSVGSVACFSSLIAAFLLRDGTNMIFAILVGLLTGAILGTINGTIITLLKIPFFIVTLSMMTLVRGVGFLLTGGLPISDLGDDFQKIGKGLFLGLPVPFWIIVVVYGILFIVLNYTKFGRYVYAIGGNTEAVRLSGINVKLYTTIAYTLSGMLAALAGIVLASRLDSGQPTACDGWEMDAIAATVIGGTKLSGGEGKIVMTLVGALILGVMSNGLNILRVSSYWQFVLKGLVILIAVGISVQTWSKRTKQA